MARKKLKISRRPSPPTLRVALAIFVIVCGAVLLIASTVDRKEKRVAEPPAVKELRRTASAVKRAVADTERVLGEVEGARNALEATDYGQARQYLQDAQEGLNELGARLDSLRAALEKLAKSPGASNLQAGASMARADDQQR